MQITCEYQDFLELHGGLGSPTCEFPLASKLVQHKHNICHLTPIAVNSMSDLSILRYTVANFQQLSHQY